MKKVIFIVGLILLTGLTYGQTIKKGVVISVKNNNCILKPDVTMNQFLDFIMNKHIPEFEKNFPGVKEYLLWGDRGKGKNQIAILDVYESVAIRDKYWKEYDVPTEEGKAAKEKMLPLFDETFKYLVDFTEESTEWIIK
jgi:hypothetical protein